MKKLMSIFGATLFVSALMFTSCTSEEATAPEETVIEEVITEEELMDSTTQVIVINSEEVDAVVETVTE
ncbi:MAG: hypothetical protein ACKVJW_01735 [Flavobacteriales bacterium]|jgi:hypothetical protein|tara:strand:- start:98 stop:304 length:207 start_codon:yes stop_codon:yes gene_type:complete